jgi:hypothetical protein
MFRLQQLPALTTRLHLGDNVKIRTHSDSAQVPKRVMVGPIAPLIAE